MMCHRLFLCLVVCAAAPDVDGGEIADLERAIGKARGVYRDAGRATDTVTQNTVLLLSFNKGYIHFFENWACHAKRLGLKYLAWPEEAAALRALEDSTAGKDPGCTIYHSKTLAASHPIDDAPSDYHSKNFKVLTKFKFITVLATLRRGVHVWFSDVDIAFLRDPWPGILATSQGADYVFQSNVRPDQVRKNLRRRRPGQPRPPDDPAWCGRTRAAHGVKPGQSWGSLTRPQQQEWAERDCGRRLTAAEGPWQEINTGFHWFRAGSKATAVLDGAVSEMYGARHQSSTREDQYIFNMYLRSTSPWAGEGAQPSSRPRHATAIGPAPPSDAFRIRALNQTQHPVGTVDEAFLKRHESVLIHANWMVGKKKKNAKLHELGLWVAHGGLGDCQPFPFARYHMQAPAPAPRRRRGGTRRGPRN